jgi:hypothetical protein
LARYPVAWHALIDALRHDPAGIDPKWADLQARVQQVVESDGGTRNLPSDARETIVRRAMPMLVSGSPAPKQRGTDDGAYVRYVRRLTRNLAKDLFRQNPQLLRALIDKPLVDKPLMFPETVSDSPLDEKRLGRFKRRFKRLSYRDRFLLRLVVIEEQTIGQIADQLRVSFADATTRLFRLFASLGL